MQALTDSDLKLAGGALIAKHAGHRWHHFADARDTHKRTVRALKAAHNVKPLHKGTIRQALSALEPQVKSELAKGFTSWLMRKDGGRKVFKNAQTADGKPLKHRPKTIQEVIELRKQFLKKHPSKPYPVYGHFAAPNASLTPSHNFRRALKLQEKGFGHNPRMSSRQFYREALANGAMADRGVKYHLHDYQFGEHGAGMSGGSLSGGGIPGCTPIPLPQGSMAALERLSKPPQDLKTRILYNVGGKYPGGAGATVDGGMPLPQTLAQADELHHRAKKHAAHAAQSQARVASTRGATGSGFLDEAKKRLSYCHPFGL